MLSINFNKEQSYYLRKGVKKIEIDEENLEFINGIAVAKAKVYCFLLEKTAVGYTPRMTNYFCEGLINKSLAPVFQTNSSEFVKYFIFAEENKKIIRFGENDFIVEREEKGTHHSTSIHLRFINNKIYKVLETNSRVTKTSNDNLAILDNQFYYVNASKFYGPKFEILKEVSDSPNEFIVMDKIVYKIGDISIMDILSFQMNANFQVTSKINSIIDGNYLYYNTTNYLEIRNERLKELEQKMSLFIKETDSLDETFSHKLG